MDLFRPPSSETFSGAKDLEAPGLRTRLARQLGSWLDKKSGIMAAPDSAPAGRGLIEDRPEYHMYEQLSTHASTGNSPFDLPIFWEVYKSAEGRRRIVIGYIGEEKVDPTPVPVPGRPGLSVLFGIYSGRIRALDLEPWVDMSNIENLYLPADLGRLWVAKTGERASARRTAAVVNCVLKFEEVEIIQTLLENPSRPWQYAAKKPKL